MKTKFLYAFLFTMAYVGVLIATYIVHVSYFSVDVVFYSAILDAIIAAIVLISIIFIFLPPRYLNAFELSLLVMIWLLGGYAFAITVPTVIDRSLSFYILEKLQQRGGGIEKTRFKDMLIQEFIPESRVIDIRLTEQLESKTITIENGCVKLTERGRVLASFSRFFRRHFLPKHRLLDDEYTDALVDPLSSSPKGRMGYEC